MDGNLRSVEIEDSLERRFNRLYYFIFYIFVFINAFILALAISSIFVLDSLKIFGFCIILLIFVNIVFYSSLHDFSRFHKPIQRVKIVISEEKIEIFLQNRLFREYIWRYFEEVIITKEGFWGFRINFRGSYSDEHIRLHVLAFDKSETKMVLSSLEAFSNHLKKDFIIANKKEKADDEEVQKEFKEFREFRDAFRVKNKAV